MISAPDGRLLRVEEAGDPGGHPVVVHHGSPGAGHLYGPHVADALDRGIRLIGYVRPGYGGSSPLAGRSVADCVADVRTIADALGIDRLAAVWGVSGGGPHALACAPGLDYFSGMGEENVEDIRLLLKDEAAARAKSSADREHMDPECRRHGPRLPDPGLSGRRRGLHTGGRAVPRHLPSRRPRTGRPGLVG